MKGASCLITGFLVLVLGCGSASRLVDIQKDENTYARGQKRLTKSASFLDAMQNLDFRYLDKPELEEEEKEFGHGLQRVVEGDFSSAVEAFDKLRHSAKDDRIREKAEEILADLLMTQSKWSEAAVLDRVIEQDEDNLMPIIRAFGNAPKERLVFSQDAMTVTCDLGISDTPIVEVELNGQRRKLWLDTGAGISVLASDVAEECGVRFLTKIESLGRSATLEKFPLRAAIVEKLVVGNMVVHNHPVAIVEKDILEFKLFGLFTILKVEGIIGWPLLRQVRTEIDFPDQRVTFKKPVITKGKERNLLWLGVPIVRLASRRGIPLHFLIDTGSPTTNLYNNIFRKIQAHDITTKRITMWSGGSRDFLSKIVDELRISLSGYRLTFKDIGTVPNPSSSFVRLDGSLGNDIAREGKMVIDPPNGQFMVVHDSVTRKE